MRNFIGRLTGYTRQLEELEDERRQWEEAAREYHEMWRKEASEARRLVRESRATHLALAEALPVIDQARRQLNLKPAEGQARSVRDKLATVSHRLREAQQ